MIQFPLGPLGTKFPNKRNGRNDAFSSGFGVATLLQDELKTNKNSE